MSETTYDILQTVRTHMQIETLLSYVGLALRQVFFYGFAIVA
jgi:hypothetical protein